MVPILLGNALLQINNLVDRMLASNLAEGSISALNFATRVYILPQNIFVMAVATVIYPTMSQFASQRKLQDLKVIVRKSLSSITFLVIPMTVGAIILREPIIRLLFERGEFDSLATQRTAYALFFLLFWYVGYFIKRNLK